MAHDALATVIAPVSRDAFFEGYFERRPLHIERRDADWFAEVYDVAEVESSIVAGANDREKFALVKSGAEPIPAAEYTVERRSIRYRQTGRGSTFALDPRAIALRFDEGYTLVVKDAGSFSLRLQKFCNRLQRRLGFYVQANVYFTPPRGSGFDVHHDTHDTVILQVEGRKTWRIYEPAVELPLETQPFSSEAHGKNLRLWGEVELNAGDTLYVPHGWPHAGAAGDARSLHVTLALSPVRALDLLEAMLQVSAHADPELRRALPSGWYEDPGYARRFAASIAPRLGDMFAPDRAVAATELVLRELFSVTRTEGGGLFEQLRRFAAAGFDATVRLGDATPFVVRRRGEALEVLAAGRTMAFPAEYAGLLERLAEGPMTMAEADAALPGGVGPSLIRLLIVEGIAVLD